MKEQKRFGIFISGTTIISVLLGILGNFVYDSLKTTLGIAVPYLEVFIIAFLPWILVAASLVYYFTSIRRRISNSGINWNSAANIAGLNGYAECLTNSDYYPSKLLAAVDSELIFMGHDGIKWSTQQTAMREMLKRVNWSRGKVKFLLLDPFSSACTESSLIRYNDRHHLTNRLLASLMIFRSLVQDYPECLEVRLYKHKPYLRLAFIDREIVAVGHYQAFMADSANSPILIFNHKPTWSFYRAFMAIFEEEWSDSKPIDWIKIEENFKENCADIDCGDISNNSTV